MQELSINTALRTNVRHIYAVLLKETIMYGSVSMKIDTASIYKSMCYSGQTYVYKVLWFGWYCAIQIVHRMDKVCFIKLYIHIVGGLCISIECIRAVTYFF